MWSGTAGAMARTPWACRPRCTTRSRPTAARSGCTATTAAPTPRPAGLVGGGAGHQAGALRTRKAAGTGQDRTLESHRARPVPGRGRPRTGGARCTSLDELNRLFTVWLHQQYHRAVHSETEATPAQRYHAEGRTRPPDRIRRGCAGRSCGVSSARSPRSRRCRCTATATRSTRPWSAAPSTCCSPRST